MDSLIQKITKEYPERRKAYSIINKSIKSHLPLLETQRMVKLSLNYPNWDLVDLVAFNHFRRRGYNVKVITETGSGLQIIVITKRKLSDQIMYLLTS